MVKHTQIIIALCFLSLISFSIQRLYQSRSHHHSLFYSQNTVTSHFDQKLDHSNPADKTTFSQRFFNDDSSWDKTSGPLILYICGEGPCHAEGDGSMVGYLKKELKANVFSLEHRYYGETQPTTDWSTENLKYLTVENALDDMANFIAFQNSENKKKYGETVSTKWITIGGSYAGGLSGWFRARYPHLTIGALSSSGVVNAITDFTQFDTQIRISASRSSQKCADTMSALNQYVDQELTNNTPIGAQIKQLFNASQMPNDEFLFMFVDGMVESVQYGSRVGLCNGLAKSDTIMNQISFVRDFAATMNPLSINDYWSKILGETTIYTSKSGRQWNYQVCTQLGWFQTPPKENSIRSKKLDLAFWKSYCSRIYGKDLFPDTENYDNMHGGVNLVATNIVYANGSEDPWQWATHYGKADEKLNAHSIMIECDSCAHCVDLGRVSDRNPKNLQIAQAQILGYMKEWVAGNETEETELSFLE